MRSTCCVGGFARGAVQSITKNFALAHVADFAVAERSQRVLDRLALRIEDRAL
jgi:hypothetical protein